MQAKATLPAERADRELEPGSWTHRLLFDPSPEAQRDWIESLLTVPNERAEVVKFHLYPQQWRMLQEQTGRDITVKGRQTRASSLILARNLRRMTTGFSLRCLVVTQSDQTTALFRRRIEHHLQDLARRGLDYPIVSSNKDELVIGKELNNSYLFASGEERVTGRSYSAQIAHLSEISHWRPETAGELVGGIVPAVPGAPVGWMDMESTPNGAEGLFYEYAQDAFASEGQLQPWRVHFYPWWLEPRYRAGLEITNDLILDSVTLQGFTDSFDPSHRERFLMEQYSLSVEQMLWRRWRERELAKTGIPFAQEYVEDFSSCWITGSENYFAAPDGKDHLSWYRDQCTDPVERIESLPYRGSAVSFYGRNLQVWEMPDVRSTYAGFCDLAEGGSGADHDFSALTIVNAMTRHHAATLRLKCSPNDFGAMACAVGQFYNQATIGGERGNYGSAALDKMRSLSYPRIYYHIELGQNRTHPEPWIFPTQQHRDELLAALREGVFEHSFLTRDRVAVSEMGTFGWHKVATTRPGYKARAKKRKHDDLVISLAGALFIARRVYRAPRARLADQPEEVIVGRHGVVLSRGQPPQRKPWFR